MGTQASVAVQSATISDLFNQPYQWIGLTRSPFLSLISLFEEYASVKDPWKCLFALLHFNLLRVEIWHGFHFTSHSLTAAGS